MPFTDTKERGLETLIVDWLRDRNGYEEGTNADYDRGNNLRISSVVNRWLILTM